MTAPVWMPGTYTPSLTGTEDFVTDGDLLLQVVDLAWQSTDADRFALDDWQRWLLRHLLERYPDDWPDARLAGRLRYRQAVVSLGRQNGKSVIGAVLALYGLLLQCKGPEVVSVASTVEQARIVYARVRYVLENSPSLRRRFKATGTRGVTSRIPASPASYVVKAGAEEGLQGFPMSLCIADEVHLWKDETWSAIVLGTSAKPDAAIIGITTAGDDGSALLKRLYEVGHKAASAADDADERFGFFLWEAPAHLSLSDPDALRAANPAIACGRLDLDRELATVRAMPEMQARRYRLNQFVASTSSWLPMDLWNGADKGTVPDGVPYVLAVARAENWQYATITAAAKVGDRVHTEVVASLINPTLESLEEVLRDLHRRRRPLKIFMEAATLRDLALRLRDSGLPIEYVTTGGLQNVCASAYAALKDRKVTHADDPLVNVQQPRAVAKNVGDGWRISHRDSAGDIDAVMATVLGVYGALTTKPNAPAIWVG